MTEIGKSLPNLTGPIETSEILAFKNVYLSSRRFQGTFLRGEPCRAMAAGSTHFRIFEYEGCAEGRIRRHNNPKIALDEGDASLRERGDRSPFVGHAKPYGRKTRASCQARGFGSGICAISGRIHDPDVTAFGPNGESARVRVDVADPGERAEEVNMVLRLPGNHDDLSNARNAIWVQLKCRIPEVLRIVLLAREVTGIRRFGVRGECKGERDPHDRPVRAFGLALEVEHVEISDARGAERLGIRRRTPALQYQHRESLIAREEVTRKAGEGKGARRGGGYQFRLIHTKKLDENAGELHDMVVRAPGMTIAAADREPGATIECRGRVEVTDRVNDVVETMGHPKPQPEGIPSLHRRECCRHQ